VQFVIGFFDPGVEVEFVTGRTGPRKTRAPGPFPRPAPLNGLGRGVFFGIPCPCPRSGPRPTHTPDGSPLKIGGNKRGPVQGMSAGGPLTGAGRGLPETYPTPAPCKGGVWRVKTRPAPHRNEHYVEGVGLKGFSNSLDEDTHMAGV